MQHNTFVVDTLQNSDDKNFYLELSLTLSNDFATIDNSYSDRSVENRDQMASFVDVYSGFMCLKGDAWYDPTLGTDYNEIRRLKGSIATAAEGESLLWDSLNNIAQQMPNVKNAMIDNDIVKGFDDRINVKLVYKT